MSFSPLDFVLGRTAFAIAAFFCIGAATGLFAQAPEVSVKLAANQVIVNGDKESLVTADKVKPGDVIEYKAVYTNTGKAAAQNVAATVPIPVGLALVAESARPTAEQASLDGKSFSAYPLTRKAITPDGTTEEKPVPPNEYRALRWQVSQLAPGSSITVALRARVLTNEPKQ